MVGLSGPGAVTHDVTDRMGFKLSTECLRACTANFLNLIATVSFANGPGDRARGTVASFDRLCSCTANLDQIATVFLCIWPMRPREAPDRTLGAVAVGKYVQYLIRPFRHTLVDRI